MVVHPHVLISASRLGDMLSCERKAVLQETVKGDDMGRSAVIGNLAHAVFQEMLSAHECGEETIRQAIGRALRSGVGELAGVAMSSREAEQQLLAYLPNILQFFETYRPGKGEKADEKEKPDNLAHNPQHKLATPHKHTEKGLVNFGSSGEDYRVSLLGPAQDIEEMVTSARYGLQGRLDATVQVHLRLPLSSSVPGRMPPTRRLLLPFEIKSGKPHMLALAPSLPLSLPTSLSLSLSHLPLSFFLSISPSISVSLICHSSLLSRSSSSLSSPYISLYDFIFVLSCLTHPIYLSLLSSLSLSLSLSLVFLPSPSMDLSMYLMLSVCLSLSIYLSSLPLLAAFLPFSASMPLYLSISPLSLSSLLSPLSLSLSSPPLSLSFSVSVSSRPSSLPLSLLSSLLRPSNLVSLSPLPSLSHARVTLSLSHVGETDIASQYGLTYFLGSVACVLLCLCACVLTLLSLPCVLSLPY